MTALSVVGIGMRSSLGGVVTSCAAARAGVARRRSVAVVPSGAADPFEASGHVCPEVAALQDWGRLCGLVVLALQDLEPSVLAGLRADARAQIHVAMPGTSHRAALDQVEEVDRALPGGAVGFLRDRIRTWLGWSIDVASISLHEGTSPAGCVALLAANQALEARACEQVVFVGVDSLVEEANVDQVLGQGRLKSGAQPNGFHPGEGAAALVLRRAPLARGGAVTELMRIESSLIETAAGEPSVPPRPSQAALASVLAAFLADGEPVVEHVGGLLTDLNGEPHRVQVLWQALHQLGQPGARLRQREQWHIAESFGELGAATLAFQLCVAARAFARGYAPGPQLLAICADESGAAIAVRVSRPEVPVGRAR